MARIFGFLVLAGKNEFLFFDFFASIEFLNFWVSIVDSLVLESGFKRVMRHINGDDRDFTILFGKLPF